MTNDDVLDELEAAYRNLMAVEDRIAEHGEDTVHQVASAYRNANELLNHYEEPASGSGRGVFESYIEFEGRLVDFVNQLPEDFPERQAFERMADVLDKRRLSPADFEQARELLSPAADLASLLTTRTEAKQRYQAARHAVTDQIHSLNHEINEVEQLTVFDDTDFELPVDELLVPITTYNDAVTHAFDSFLREANAREVFSLLETSERYPLIDFPDPPSRLKNYLVDRPPGSIPIPRVIEYTEYSPSKLEHYVDNPTQFRTEVATNRRYFNALTADPLTIEIPAPAVDALKWRVRELIPILNRFASDSVITKLHAVRDLTNDPQWYERLRETSRARHHLDSEEREKLKNGSIHQELKVLHEQRSELEAALDRHPDA